MKANYMKKLLAYLVPLMVCLSLFSASARMVSPVVVYEM